MPLFSVVISFNNKKRAFAETLFYYPCHDLYCCCLLALRTLQKRRIFELDGTHGKLRREDSKVDQRP